MITILLAEDEEMIRSMYALKLRNAGYRVIEAKDGEEGLEKIKEFLPELVILDIRMPNKDGVEVLGEIRRTEWGKTLKVIMLTGLDTDEKLLRSVVSLEPSYYLVKSKSNPQELVEKVNQLVNEDDYAKDIVS